MDFIINATFSFANYYIDKTTYFRICNAVNNSLQEDLEFLQMNFSEENELPYSDEVQGLINQGLMEKEGPQWQSFDEQSEASKPYKFTLLAKYVDKYALSNSDFERYPDLIRGGSTGGQTNCR